MAHEPAHPAPARHVPVLLSAVLEYLAPQPGQTLADVTVGAGGHAQAIAQRLGASGTLLALDQDPTMLALAQQRVYPCRVVWCRAKFDALPAVLAEQGISALDGVLADLGISSDQLDDPQRGFSFLHEGPLDMRLDPTANIPTAADLLARLSERELADILWRYGEERYSRRIARRIVQTRQRQPIRSTTQLAQLVRSCVPRSGRIDPATRTFQALRIAVNDELGTLQHFLQALPQCLRVGGRAVIISFHSLEDRLVKQAFRQGDRWLVLTKKPVRPDAAEIRANPRARSARLRAAQLLARAS
ncbi:MAG: 16S rRNA (cytosine(1402)-N(4))-methyltransferase RsmH [Gemmatales bacterium]|nr:16S rRNA (cytosine(1402)-N(4))-methyltransferase RsmH [Gemmatales bacterium]MDW7995796.1 16S rRNA (cytosine(1402)-N(4))-methyltransferase RsmH [Gemmatales bacterium]